MLIVVFYDASVPYWFVRNKTALRVHSHVKRQTLSEDKATSLESADFAFGGKGPPLSAADHPNRFFSGIFLSHQTTGKIVPLA